MTTTLAPGRQGTVVVQPQRRQELTAESATKDSWLDQCSGGKELSSRLNAMLKAR